MFLHTRCGYEVPGMILVQELIALKTNLCMFQLVLVTISTH